jgi:TPR repeat protein
MANVTPRAPIEATKVADVPAIADEGVSKTSAVPTTEAAAVRKVPQSITPPTMLQVDSYLRRASELVALGDIAAARLLLSRAAEGKDSRALVALAETYDPVVLGRWRVVGMKPDPDRARALYQQALEAGNKAAGEHLLAMR